MERVPGLEGQHRDGVAPGTKPSTSGTAARTSSGERAVRVCGAGEVMGTTLARPGRHARRPRAGRGTTPSGGRACGGFGGTGRYVAGMRAVASVLHLDLDAFFAAVEQRDKPSLRGKPVVVGGVGGRGVVATASYEARRYGVRSAMSTREARSRCPHAAFLTGRFHAYRAASEAVMAVLRDTSRRWSSRSRSTRPSSTWPRPTCPTWRSRPSPRWPSELRRRVAEVTGGLTASVGLGTSKFIAKVASDLDKPDGLDGRAARHRDGPAPPDARLGDPRRRPGHRRAAAPGRHPQRGRPRGGQRGRAGADARQRPRPRAAPPRPRPRRPAGGARAGDQVGQRRGHLRHRPDRPPADGRAAHPAGRTAWPTG